MKNKTIYLYGMTRTELNKQLYYVTMNVLSNNNSLTNSCLADLISDARQDKRIEILKEHRHELVYSKDYAGRIVERDTRINKVIDAIDLWKRIKEEE